MHAFRAKRETESSKFENSFLILLRGYFLIFNNKFIQNINKKLICLNNS